MDMETTVMGESDKVPWTFWGLVFVLLLALGVCIFAFALLLLSLIK